jgi:hypothetical protein
MADKEPIKRTIRLVGSTRYPLLDARYFPNYPKISNMRVKRRFTMA